MWKCQATNAQIYLVVYKHTSIKTSLPEPMIAHTPCTHTHTHTHTMPCPLSTKQQMVYLSTNKIVLKDQAVHFQAKVNWFFHHGCPPLQSSRGISVALLPFFHQPFHNHLCQVINDINIQTILPLWYPKWLFWPYLLLWKPLSCEFAVDMPGHLDQHWLIQIVL